MSVLPKTKGGLAALFAVAGAVLALLAMSPLAGKGGALLLLLLFWVAVVEGCIAAAAAGAMVNARWIGAVRRELLSLSPLLLLLAFLLLLLIPFLDLYPWAGRPGIWLRKEFFIARNLALLLLAYVTARRFANAGDEETTRVRAAAYLFVFVASQTLVAFDLVMSLEYPWYSALFGGYFFIESVYGGFAVSAILCILLHGRPPGASDPESRSDLKDIAILMFGFSLLWAGFFFAQYLTIWYGNIPEEVGFIARRVSVSPFRELSIAIVCLFFLIPFPALLSTRAKTNPYAVSAASVSILSGILIERYVFVAPAIRLNGWAVAVVFLCLLFLFVVVVSGRARGFPLEG